MPGLDIVRRDWCGLAKEMGEAGSGRCLSGSSEVCDPKSSEMKYCNGATHADPCRPMDVWCAQICHADVERFDFLEPDLVRYNLERRS